MAACRDAGFDPRLGEPASGTAVWTAIAAGRGVGLVVGSLAEQLPPGIALVALQPPAPVLIFDLVWALEHDGPFLGRLRDPAVAASERHGWTRAPRSTPSAGHIEEVHA